ncbi:hypothetical protein [Thalassobius litoralis]|uniref:hypothetical protein n=1 Tax=Thalassovita litoralis TaxID=1010611 RepID=UPI001F3857B8|nr:hypothetical protein [Thalassovita litoralis]
MAALGFEPDGPLPGWWQGWPPREHVRRWQADLARTALMDTWADFDGSAGAEIDVLFEIRETDDDPAASPNWGPWGRLDNHEIEARAVEARAFLTTKDASYTPIVSQLRLYADEVA